MMAVSYRIPTSPATITNINQIKKRFGSSKAIGIPTYIRTAFFLNILLLHSQNIYCFWKSDETRPIGMQNGKQ